MEFITNMKNIELKKTTITSHRYAQASPLSIMLIYRLISQQVIVNLITREVHLASSAVVGQLTTPSTHHNGLTCDAKVFGTLINAHHYIHAHRQLPGNLRCYRRYISSV